MIYKDIQAERLRQNEKHPILPPYFLHPKADPLPAAFGYAENKAKEDNDAMEAKGQHSWYGIIREELYEVFSESGDTVESLTKMRAEAVQGAALYVRLIEQIDQKLNACKKP